MRHSVFGRKFSRTKNERRRLLQGLVRAVITHGAIRTTLAKAKAVQPLVEKLVTRAKAGGSAARRRLLQEIDDVGIVDQLLADAKTQFAARSSGFTRIVHLGRRAGDAAEEVLLQFVDAVPAGRQEKFVADVIPPKKEEKTPRKATAAKVPAKRGRPRKSPK